MQAFLIANSLKDNLRARKILPWIFVTMMAATIAYLWGSLSPSSSQTDQYSNISSILVFRMLALMSAIFTTAIISQEVEQKTIVYLLTRPVPRWMLLITRYIATSIVVAVLGMVAIVAVSAAVYKAHALTNPLLLKDFVAMIVGAFAYGGLFLLISLFFNRSMIVCLLYAFGWETAVPNMPGDIDRLSIFSYLQAIAEHPSALSANQGLNAVSGALGSGTISRSTGYTSLFLLVLVTVAVSAWWFTTHEYVPREDAE